MPSRPAHVLDVELGAAARLELGQEVLVEKGGGDANTLWRAQLVAEPADCRAVDLDADAGRQIDADRNGDANLADRLAFDDLFDDQDADPDILLLGMARDLDHHALRPLGSRCGIGGVGRQVALAFRVLCRLSCRLVLRGLLLGAADRPVAMLGGLDQFRPLRLLLLSGLGRLRLLRQGRRAEQHRHAHSGGKQPNRSGVEKRLGFCRHDVAVAVFR